MNQTRPGSGPPPLPPKPAPSPPPKRRMHGCLIALIVAACLAIPALGILVAIALPAYQDYVARAKVAQALAETLPLRPQVADFVARNARCPVNGDEGFGEADGYRGAAHGAVAFGEAGGNACAIEILLQGGRGDAIDGQRLWLEYDVDGGTWRCSSEAADRYLPADCRDRGTPRDAALPDP